MRLRSTAEQEEIDAVHLEGVYEIVPMQERVDLHECLALAEATSLTQTSCTDIFLRRFCGFNKHGAWLNRDVCKLVIEVKDYDISRAYFQGTKKRNSFTSDRSVC